MGLCYKTPGLSGIPRRPEDVPVRTQVNEPSGDVAEVNTLLAILSLNSVSIQDATEVYRHDWGSLLLCA